MSKAAPPSSKLTRRKAIAATLAGVAAPAHGGYASVLAPGAARVQCFYPKVDEAAKRFGTRRLVGLLCGPGVGCRNHFDRKAQGDMRVLSRSRTPASFLWDVFS